MSATTPTTPSLLSPDPVPAIVLATATLGTPYALDLRTKWGAWLMGRIGRHIATALTVSARIVVRRMDGAAVRRHPSTNLDLVSAIAAVNFTTLNGALSIGATTATLTSATGFAAGDLVCLHSNDTSANRVEWARVSSVSGSVLTFDAALILAHNNGDAISNGADVFGPVFIPGGHEYEVIPDNGASGQSVVFECIGETIDSYTTA